MGVLALSKQPQVSWERTAYVSNSYWSQSMHMVPAGYQLWAVLDRAWDTDITIDVVPSSPDGAQPGIDYYLYDRRITFKAGETRKSVSWAFLGLGGFRRTRNVDFRLREAAEQGRNKGAKGKYSTWRCTLYGQAAPPTVNFVYSGTAVQNIGASEAYTCNVALSEASRETTIIPIDFAGTTLSKPSQYTLTGTYWNDTDGQFEIPAGVTTAQLDVTLKGTPGQVRLTMDLPSEHVRRNMMTFTGYGMPERGVKAGTESGKDYDAKFKDDNGQYAGSETDWVLGCDASLGEDYWSLIPVRSSTVTAPDGSYAMYYAPTDEGPGAGSYGCVRKSFEPGIIGGWDYGGVVGTLADGSVGMVVVADVPMKTGYNIWSAHLKNDTAESTFSQAPYSKITLLNRGRQSGISKAVGEDVQHDVVVQWIAGVPSIISTTSGVLYSGITNEGGGWYRIYLVYHAPALADGDTCNWFVRPCDHPSQDVSLHYRKGAYVWGCQFEYDPSRTLTAPTAYQHVEEQTFFEATAIAGATPGLIVIGS